MGQTVVQWGTELRALTYRQTPSEVNKGQMLNEDFHRRQYEGKLTLEASSSILFPQTNI